MNNKIGHVIPLFFKGEPNKLVGYAIYDGKSYYFEVAAGLND